MNQPLHNTRILLGVTGGIAAYKCVALARGLTQAGAEVDVILTRSAREFVGGVTFEAITGRPVHEALIAEGHALEHITLARECHAIVVAPATADFLSRAAAGRADDLLAACLLATDAPVILSPAMNDRMWAHPTTQANVARLRSIGYHVMDPGVGPLASPTEGAGPGRMREPDEIVSMVAALLAGSGGLRGHRVVVTAGPTREALDPVRFISNRSSGRMGIAIARAARRRGAEVVLIAGPITVAVPQGCRTVSVETTAEMATAVREALPGASALIMAAAPADFRPRDAADQKIKKDSGISAIALEPTPDILKTTRDARPDGCVVVGFALETANLVGHAREKLRAKALDMVVANDAAEPGAGFGGDTNRVTFVLPDDRVEALPMMSKDEVAERILDRVEGLLRER